MPLGFANYFDWHAGRKRTDELIANRAGGAGDLFGRGAVDADGDRLTPSVRLAKMVCSWWRLAASATGPGAPGGDSRSWSKSVDVVVDSSESTWESVPPTRSHMPKSENDDGDV